MHQAEYKTIDINTIMASSIPATDAAATALEESSDNGNNSDITIEDKTDHGNVITPQVVNNSSTWDPLATVDSALLSALCDARERKALLRLEHTLCEFTNNPSLDSIEVGGAYNSIVLAENEGVNRGRDLYTCMSPSNITEFQNQHAKGMRQTSFQRLILHRLADRFGIVREVIPQNENIVTSLNLIRLIKTEATLMPSHLLVDVDLGLLVDYKNPLARSDRNGGLNSHMNMERNNNNAQYGYSGIYNGGYNNNNCGTPNMMEQQQDHQNMRQLSDSMGSTNIMENKKMVIMKRNNSNGENSNNNGSKKKEGTGRNRKKAVDKEKAYEEARARIFGAENKSDETRSDAVVAADEIDNEKLTEKRGLNPQVTEFKPQLSFGEVSSHPSSASLTNSEPVASGGSEDLNNAEKSNSPQESTSDEGAAASTKSKPKSKSNNKKQGKAVYRNRQQEEADPDFKRRSTGSYYTPYNHAQNHNPYAPSNPYNNMVNVSMGNIHPNTNPASQQHMAMAMGGQHYYGQPSGGYYPNHGTPQSPAFFVPPGGFPHMPSKHPMMLNQVAQPQHTQPPQNPPDISKSDVVSPNKMEASAATSKELSIATTDITQKGEVSIGVAASSSFRQNATKPEDFPALTS